MSSFCNYSRTACLVSEQLSTTRLSASWSWWHLRSGKSERLIFGLYPASASKCFVSLGSWNHLWQVRCSCDWKNSCKFFNLCHFYKIFHFLVGYNSLWLSPINVRGSELLTLNKLMARIYSQLAILLGNPQEPIRGALKFHFSKSHILSCIKLLR